MRHFEKYVKKIYIKKYPTNNEDGVQFPSWGSTSTRYSKL